MLSATGSVFPSVVVVVLTSVKSRQSLATAVVKQPTPIAIVTSTALPDARPMR